MARSFDRVAPGALLVALAWACGRGAGPAEPVHDLLQVERAVAAARADLARGLSAALGGAGDLPVARGFRGRLARPAQGRALPDATLSVLRLARGADGLDAREFGRRLSSYAPGWGAPERFEFDFERFLLAPDGASATGRARVAWGASAGDERRARLELRAEVELARAAGGWRLTRCEVEDGTRVEGAGPRFRDVSDAAGLRLGDSAENRALTQAAIDHHRTLAIGGLSVVDWDRDGFPDLVVTRRAQDTLLFRNDGRGGFVPEDLPVRSPAESPAFLLVLDLDGDGLDELASTRVLRYDGERASLGIYRQRDGAWELDERALEFAIPRGRRRISAQTLAPFDANGDGRLDLFVGVYGDALSRGEDYDTIDAKDGARNCLFLNQGGLRFTEEARERGLFGTRYTYVGVPFDLDQDGDVDLFEGNDFGPNVLWTNDGQGHFRADPAAPFADLSTYSMGASIGDFDAEGSWSLYVANMAAPAGARALALADDLGPRMRSQVASIGAGNALYTRDPGTGAWRERARELGIADAGWAWGSLFCDVDGDGDLDLVSTNGFATHSRPGLPDWEPLYWRQVLADARALEHGEPIRDVNADVPFEGSLSGHQRDRLFHNLDGSAEFVEAAWIHGLDADQDGRCVAPLDVDGDGDLDLALYTLGRLVLWENRSAPTHFARLRLRATRGDPQALGAVVTLEADGAVRRSFVRALDGFQTQVLLDVHFGLAAAERIERLTVEWPDGEREVWEDLPVDRLLRVCQGAAHVEAEPLPRWPEASRPRPLPRRPSGLEAAHGPWVVRIAPAAAPEAWTLAGELTDAGARMALATLGAPTDDEPAPPPGALRAGPELAAACFGDSPPVAPAVLVYAPDGALARAFLYDPPAADVAAVLRTLDDEPAFPEPLVFAGRQALDEHRQRDAVALFERALATDPTSTPALDGLARAQVALGRLDLAEAAYARAVEVDPDYALGYFNLGVTRVHRGRPQDALAPLTRALELAGERPEWLLALGEAAAAAERPGDALAAFERAGAADPAAAEPRVLAAKILAGMGRYPEARARLEEALRLDPGSSDARRTLRAVERQLPERP